MLTSAGTCTGDAGPEVLADDAIGAGDAGPELAGEDRDPFTPFTGDAT